MVFQHVRDCVIYLASDDDSLVLFCETAKQCRIHRNLAWQRISSSFSMASAKPDKNIINLHHTYFFIFVEINFANNFNSSGVAVIIPDHIDKIMQSEWWSRAACCVDSHYSNTSGIMLIDHLVAVTENVNAFFNRPFYGFHAEMLTALDSLNLDRRKVQDELKLVSLLHDIGKVEDDKMLYIIHPMNNELVLKRHTVVSVSAAMEIFDEDPVLNAAEKLRLYWAIEQHDISYGLYKQFLHTGFSPDFYTWKMLNDKIFPSHGAGLMYLLIFKLADIHGHANIGDVIWFYKTVRDKYFSPLGLYLPIPVEDDMR